MFEFRNYISILRPEKTKGSDCIIIILGQPVLQLLTDKKHFVKDYWGYKNSEFHYLEPNENKLELRIYPFAHLSSINNPRSSFYRDHLNMYIQYVKEQHHLSQG